ncbi:MAG: Dabb family protein [Bacteroidota bacterium]
MKNLLFLPCLLFLLGNCSNPALQQELQTAKADLAKAEASIQQLQQQLEVVTADQSATLTHFVFLSLREGADSQACLDELKKLTAIQEVKDMALGPFEDLNDARALSDYDLVMEMSFDDAAAYQRYQQHPVHLQVRDNLGAYLGGPPATYDFLRQSLSTESK